MPRHRQDRPKQRDSADQCAISGMSGSCDAGSVPTDSQRRLRTRLAARSTADLVDDLEHGLLRRRSESAVDTVLHTPNQDRLAGTSPAGLRVMDGNDIELSRAAHAVVVAVNDALAVEPVTSTR